MRRVISIFLPHWPIELRTRRLTPSAAPDKPFIIADLEGQNHSVVAVNAAAATEGILPGMPLSHARAIYPAVTLAPAQPAADARALDRLAGWCLRFSPLVSPCPPDSLWIDATGVAHLFGGEAGMLDAIHAAFTGHGLTARIAMANTPGAAWAISHFHDNLLSVSHHNDDLNALPVAALRLNLDVARALARVGLKTIADLRRIPRATLPLRFGKEMLLRLDQAFGHSPEAIDAVLPPQAQRRRLAFAEPVGTLEDLQRAIHILVPQLCDGLEKTQEGARHLDLLFQRIDSSTAAIRLNLARPSRDTAHLARLLVEKLETIDPGFGIEVMILTAWRVEPLVPQQMECDGNAAMGAQALSELVDSLSNRVGARNVYRIAAVASDVPERAAKPADPLGDAAALWPENLPRPVRLFSPPEPVDVMALMPDHPPARFSWRGLSRKIKRADGPERVFGEWWNDPREVAEVRDYFRVEDEEGERFWLFRDGRLTADQTYRWYLHGVFA